MKALIAVGTCLACLMVALLSGDLAKTAVKTLFKEIERSPTAARAEAEVMQLGLAKFEAELEPKLPIKLDDNFWMINVQTSGKTLTYFFLLTTADAAYAEHQIAQGKAKMASEWCNIENMRASLKLGAIIRYHYVNVRDETLALIELTQADCRNEQATSEQGNNLRR